MIVEVCVSVVHVVTFLTVTGTHVVKREVVIPPAEVVVLREIVVEKLVDVDTDVEVRVGIGVHDVAMVQPREQKCAQAGEEDVRNDQEEAVVEEECQVEARKADRTQQKAATACLSTQLTLLRNSTY